MKKTTTIFYSLNLLLFLSISLLAQTVGDFRTQNSGNWSMAQNWQRYNGGSWVNTATPPTGSETITVLDTDSIFADVAVSISGTMVNQGIIDAIDSLTITIADGGTYQHDRDGGTMPRCIWATGSNALITGVTAEAPGDRNQDYYNITFNTPNQLSNLNMNLDDNTISGDVRVINTGFARWYLTTALANDTSTVTVMGDIIVEDGTFSVQGTSNALTTFIVHHYGNINVTGGNFSISRGSQGGGTTTWYIYDGDFSMSNATTQSSTATPGGAKFVFAKQGMQTLNLGAGNTLTALPIEVSAGTTLDMGSSALAGSGIFTVLADAMVMTALPGGVNEIVSGIVADVTLADSSSYGFNGSAAQVTGTSMPAVVTDLTIDNAAGVTLSQETTINGVLRLVSGLFDNTIPFTLGPNGSISDEGGSILVPVGIRTLEQQIPRSFFVNQNYPNPFNPSTTIRFGISRAAYVTARLFNVLGQEVAIMFKGSLPTGQHELLFDASNLTSGVYFYQVKAGNNVAMKRMIVSK